MASRMLIGDLGSDRGEGGRTGTCPGDFERVDELGITLDGARVDEVPRVEMVRVLVLVEEGPRVEVVLVLGLGAGVCDAPPRVEVILVRDVVGVDDDVPGLRGVDMLDRFKD